MSVAPHLNRVSGSSRPRRSPQARCVYVCSVLEAAIEARAATTYMAWLETERVAEVDGVPVGKPNEVQPPRQLNRVYLRGTGATEPNPC
jgi:hypothetical protein